MGRGPAPWVGRETRVAGAPGGKSPEPRHPPPSGRLPTAIREVWQGRGPPRTRCAQQSGSHRQWFKPADTGTWAQRGQGWPGEGAQKTLPLPRGLPEGAGTQQEPRASPGQGGRPASSSPCLCLRSSPLCLSLCSACLSHQEEGVGWGRGPPPARDSFLSSPAAVEAVSGMPAGGRPGHGDPAGAVATRLGRAAAGLLARTAPR